ncbi:MAG: hydrogenase maturation protease [Novosphingobium sp.]|nr:hydrogenase maturation protease [Novosphingobium sp.]MCB2077523.1 hydrogenase maturation protease [Novosphingobium sp.]
MTAGAPVLVLCLGNSDRGDDGIGPAVAAKLDGRLPDGTALSVRSGDMLALIEDWEGFSALVCVDAAAPMERPGTIHRMDLGEQELPRDMAFVSSHAFGLPEAVALARTLGLAPPNIVVYAVEGASFEAGAPMTQAAAQAIAPLAEQVAAEAARLQELADHA